MKHNKKLIWLS